MSSSLRSRIRDRIALTLLANWGLSPSRRGSPIFSGAVEILALLAQIKLAATQFGINILQSPAQPSPSVIFVGCGWLSIDEFIRVGHRCAQTRGWTTLRDQTQSICLQKLLRLQGHTNEWNAISQIRVPVDVPYIN